MIPENVLKHASNINSTHLAVSKFGTKEGTRGEAVLGAPGITELQGDTRCYREAEKMSDIEQM